MLHQLRLHLHKGDWSQIIFLILALISGGIGGILITNSDKPILIIAAALGIGLTLLIITQPQWGIYSLIFIIHTNISDVLINTYSAPSVAQPFMVLLILTIVLRWFMYNEQPEGWLVPTILVGIYGLVAFLSLLYARDFTRAEANVSDYFKDAIVTVIVAILITRGSVLKGAVWTLLAVGIFLGSISVFQYLTGTFDNNYGGFARPPIIDIDGNESNTRVAGPIGDPNFYAQIILVLQPLALDRFWHARSLLLRVVAGAAFALTTLTILFTFSRGAFLAMVVVLGIMILRHGLNPVAILLMPLVGALILQFAPASYADRITTLADILPGQDDGATVVVDESVRGRTSEMLAAWMMFKDYPVFGVGAGNYNAYYLDYSRQIGLDPRSQNRSAHSLYLEIAAERGIVGLIAFSLLLTVVFASMIRAYIAFAGIEQKEYSELIFALMMGMLSYLLAAVLLHDAYPRIYWMLIGICLATLRVAQWEVRAYQETKSVELGTNSGMLPNAL